MMNLEDTAGHAVLGGLREQALGNGDALGTYTETHLAACAPSKALVYVSVESSLDNSLMQRKPNVSRKRGTL